MRTISSVALTFALGCVASAWLLSFLQKRRLDRVKSRSTGLHAGNSSAAISTLSRASSTSTVVVSPEVVAEVSRLRDAYISMFEDFLGKNLDPEPIMAIRPWFHGLAADEIVWPKQYTDMDPPYPTNSIRLLVIPVNNEHFPLLANRFATYTAAITSALPTGTKVFCNSRTHYHCTVFHTSHPSDTRTDPFSVDNDPAGNQIPPHERPATNELVRKQETAAIADIVASTSPPELEFHSMVLTRTGTLLLTWTDATGRVTELRNRLRDVLPGATSKQANIIHTTLLRILSPEPLTPAAMQSIKSICNNATNQLRALKTKITPSMLWWVVESEFSTIAGDKTLMPLAGISQQL